MTRLLLVIPCLVGAALVDVNEATLSEMTDTLETITMSSPIGSAEALLFFDQL